jgi:hypothetical protein
MPGQVTGTIGDQDVRFDNAATESTLILLVDAINKMSGAKGKGKDAKLQELYNRRLEESNKLKEEEAENLAALNEQLTKSKQKWQQFGQDMSAIIGSVFTNTTVGLNSLANVFDNMGPLGQIAGALTRVVYQNVEIFRQLSQSGIDLGDSILSAQTAAARAGLPLDIFTKTVTENASSLALMGGSATEGAKRFTEVSFQMRKNGFAQSLARLGFTMEEVAEHTAGYMEQLTMLGKSQSLSDAQMAEGAQAYLLELDKLTRVHGMSRKEAEAAMKTAANDKRLKALMATMGEKERIALQGVVTSLQKASPELADGVAELVATNGVPISDFGKALARNNPQLLENAKLLRQGAITQAEFEKSVRVAAQNSSALSEEEEKLHAYLVARGKSSPFADRVALMQMKNFGKEMESASAAQKAAMQAEGKAVAGFDEAMTQLAIALKVMLLPIISVVSGALGIFVKGITYIIAFFTELGNVIEGVIGKEAFGGLKEGISQVLSGLVVLALGFVAFSKFMAAKTAVGSMMSGTGVAGKAAGAVGSAAGKGAQGLGEGIGKGAGGMLGGLADGLGKLGSPKVLLGVIALAGIGATMFIAAKALQEFASVSWEDMAKGFVALAGLGVLGLVLSLAAIPIAIGAGVIALLGASLLPLAAAIAIAAPGIETISDKIQKLAGIDGDSLEGMGDALGSLGVGLAKLGGGNIMESVGSFFGGDITEKLLKFGMAAPGIMALNMAMKDLDFGRLDSSQVNFNNLELGAKRAQQLATQLKAVKSQIDSITAPSVMESLSSAFDSLSTKITAVLSKDTSGGKAAAGTKSSDSLLSDLGIKMDHLNTQVADLVDISRVSSGSTKKIARNSNLYGT